MKTPIKVAIKTMKIMIQIHIVMTIIILRYQAAGTLNDFIEKTAHVRAFRGNIKSELNSSRRLIKFFKLSSVRNSILQKHVGSHD